jgi:hypothetical protein
LALEPQSVNIGEKYRAWKEQWPEASRWALPLWLGCALLVCGGIWEIYRDSRLQDVKPEPAQSRKPGADGRQGRPAWMDQAGAVARTFPADPDLWQQAARLLMGRDPVAARNLLAMADAVRPDSAAIRQDLAAAAAGPIDSGATRAWAARAFEWEGGPSDRFLLQSVLGPTTSKSEADEAKLAESCSGRSGSAAAYAGWLMIQARWPEALSWIDRLSPAVAAAPRIRELRLELLCRLGDSEAIRSELARGGWGRSEPDAADLALCARSLSERGQGDLARDLWRAAIGACGQSPDAVKVVLRLALSFGLDRESAESFKAALALHPTDQEIAREFQIWLRLHGNPEAAAGGGAS